jgi:NTP pyrophosphatase (non-canonical NTP hydrolase)
MILNSLDEQAKNLAAQSEWGNLSVSEAVEEIGRAIKKLHEAVRRNGKNETAVKESLQKVFAAIFSAQFVSGVSLDAVMPEKYPDVCCYCQQAPCQCPPNRSGAKVHTDSVKHLNWDLEKWARHLDKVYRVKNQEFGISDLLLQLFSEQHELRQEMLKMNGNPTVSQEFCHELCDVLAWTIAVANLYHFDF